MPFVHPTTIRFSQVDAAGILYFSRAFELCHEADYAAPMRLGDALDVHLGIERVGTSSITVLYRIRSAGGTLHATVRHVHTAVDVATFRSRPLPEPVRAWQEVTP